MDDLRYPIGPFTHAGPATGADRTARILAIQDAPAELRAAVAGLRDAELERPYRPGGWTVRQVVHHLADSHLNSYTRFRLAMTEDRPTIRPYVEAEWAELEDARSAPVDLSLDLLDALHARWVRLLRSFTPADWRRELIHPEMGRALDLDEMLALYAWHGRHHTAHVTAVRTREGF